MSHSSEETDIGIQQQNVLEDLRKMFLEQNKALIESETEKKKLKKELARSEAHNKELKKELDQCENQLQQMIWHREKDELHRKKIELEKKLDVKKLGSDGEARVQETAATNYGLKNLNSTNTNLNLQVKDVASLEESSTTEKDIMQKSLRELKKMLKHQLQNREVARREALSTHIFSGGQHDAFRGRGSGMYVAEDDYERKISGKKQSTITNYVCDENEENIESTSDKLSEFK
ncbi:hypothetical protein TB2_006116 [Malus domestica]